MTLRLYPMLVALWWTLVESLSKFRAFFGIPGNGRRCAPAVAAERRWEDAPAAPTRPSRQRVSRTDVDYRKLHRGTLAKETALPRASGKSSESSARLDTVLRAIAGIRESVDERFALMQAAISERSDIEQIKETISDELRNIMQEQLKITVQRTIVDAIREEVTKTVQQQVGEAVRSEVKDVVQQEVKSTIQGALMNSVNEQVAATVREQVTAVVQQQVTSIVQQQVTSIVHQQVTSIVQQQVTFIVQQQVTAIFEKQTSSRAQIHRTPTSRAPRLAVTPATRGRFPTRRPHRL